MKKIIIIVILITYAILISGFISYLYNKPGILELLLMLFFLYFITGLFYRLIFMKN